MWIRMAEASGGDAGGAGGGQGGAAGGTGTNGGASGGAGGAAGGATGATPPWHGQADAAAVEYVTNKGWQNPADVIRSYQGAEKLIGRDPNTLLVLPRSDDPEGFRAAMTKLGMPAEPKGYEIPVPQGQTPDESYTQWARESFHKAGLTATQAKALAEAHNAYSAQRLTSQAKDYDLSVASDKQALLAEWKGGHERMMNMARHSASALGFTGDMIDAMERTIGYAATMKHFAALGQKLSEDGFVSGDGGTTRFGDMVTPAEAKQQWEAMKVDPIHSKALFDPSHPGHQAAKEKQAKLFKIMYPEG